MPKSSSSSLADCISKTWIKCCSSDIFELIFIMCPSVYLFRWSPIQFVFCRYHTDIWYRHRIRKPFQINSPSRHHGHHYFLFESFSFAYTFNGFPLGFFAIFNFNETPVAMETQQWPGPSLIQAMPLSLSQHSNIFPTLENSHRKKLSRWCVWELRWSGRRSLLTPLPLGRCAPCSWCPRPCRSTSAVGEGGVRGRRVQLGRGSTRRRRLTWCLVMSNTNQRGFQPFSRAPRLYRIPS